MAADITHPIQKRVIAKGLALKELRPYIKHICDLKDKVIKVAHDSYVDPEELLQWVLEQLEFCVLYEEEGVESESEDTTEEESDEEEES